MGGGGDRDTQTTQLWTNILRLRLYKWGQSWQRGLAGAGGDEMLASHQLSLRCLGPSASLWSRTESQLLQLICSHPPETGLCVTLNL